MGIRNEVVVECGVFSTGAIAYNCEAKTHQFPPRTIAMLSKLNSATRPARSGRSPMPWSRMLCMLLAIAMIGSILSTSTVAHSPQQIPDLNELIPEEYKTDPLSDTDHQLASGIVSSISASEWLGPLAPIAISPFFGITCLCGISQFGADYLPLNSFISTNPVLQSQTVLWVFLLLTVVTSLPRFTKVSKPVGQAIDQLEAWAGIITIVVIRFAASSGTMEPTDTTAMAETIPMVQMGMFSMTADALFSLAAVINIFVINSIKFFFEVSVWLMPIPFIDGILELANKSICAVLMAIYAWSPMVATALNLLIFAACAIAFRWCQRRVTYMRNVLFDPVWGMIQKSYGVPAGSDLAVFPQSGIGPFAPKTRLLLSRDPRGWKLRQVRFLLPTKVYEFSSDENRLTIKPGLIVNKVHIDGAETGQLVFTRRYSDHLQELAEKMNMSVEDTEDVPAVSVTSAAL